MNDITVFTKPWDREVSLEDLGRKMVSIGVQGVELTVRDGYQVEPGSIGRGLPEAVGILGDQGIKIGSVAGSVDEASIHAMGACGIKTLRICVPMDLGVGYLESEKRIRKQWDALIPALDEAGVRIGVQNHCGNFVGSAVGTMHLIEQYDPRHVSAVYDPAHCGLDGEPEVMGLDICWSHLSLVNLKSAIWQRKNGPDEPEAAWSILWTTGHNSLFSWKRLVAELKKRGYEGDICLPAEYTGYDEDGTPAGMQMGDACLGYLRKDIAYLKYLLASDEDAGR
jgi:sugar phosphate isomerase/epimerase